MATSLIDFDAIIGAGSTANCPLPPYAAGNTIAIFVGWRQNIAITSAPTGFAGRNTPTYPSGGQDSTVAYYTQKMVGSNASPSTVPISWGSAVDYTIHVGVVDGDYDASNDVLIGYGNTSFPTPTVTATDAAGLALGFWFAEHSAVWNELSSGFAKVTELYNYIASSGAMGWKALSATGSTGPFTWERRDEDFPANPESDSGRTVLMLFKSVASGGGGGGGEFYITGDGRLPATYPVTALRFDPATLTIPIGTVQTLTVYDQNDLAMDQDCLINTATPTTVRFETGPDTQTLNSSGQVQIRALAQGVSILTASFTDPEVGVVMKTLTVNVTSASVPPPPPPSGPAPVTIRCSPATVSAAAGSGGATVTVRNNSGVAQSGLAVTSEDTSVATVSTPTNADGEFDVTSVSAGRTRAKVDFTDGSIARPAYVDITVSAAAAMAAVTGLQISPSVLTLTPTSGAMSITVTDQNGNLLSEEFSVDVSRPKFIHASPASTTSSFIVAPAGGAGTAVVTIRYVDPVGGLVTLTVNVPVAP